MKIPAGGTPGAERAASAGADARLREVARQMEGAFVEQLFKAMRETVPEGGLTDGGSGEEMFAGLMDQHLSGQVPASWDRGLAASIHRQLRGKISAPATPADSIPVPGSET